MTVGAEHSQILQAVIVLYPVSVVELNRYRLSSPFRETAHVADVSKNSSGEKPSLYRVTALRLSKNPPERPLSRPNHDSP
jgi:hypothetical protein